MVANTEKASAGRNLLIYAGLVAVAAAYTVLIWGERSEIEGYRYPSGLGDGEIFDIEANPPDPDKPMVSIDGVAHFAAATAQSWRDRYMVKVARDDGDQFFLYQPTSEIGGGGIPPGSGLYLKLGQDSYMEVSPDGKPAVPETASETPVPGD